jgi:hypothetical protein
MQLQKPEYHYHPKVAEFINRLTPGTIAFAGAVYGHNKCEPLLVMIDSVIKWVDEYYGLYGHPIVEESAHAEQIKNILTACKNLLGYNSSMKSAYRLTFDPKDDGTLFNLIELAADIAGFDMEDV